MDIRTSAEGDIAIVEPLGTIDTRSAVDFEKQIVALLNDGKRLFAIGFGQVDVITSSGIRVLVMLGKRVHGNGGLALYALNDTVRTVFEISGLTSRFLITPTRQEAVGQLSTGLAAQPASAKAGSKISRLTRRLLGATDNGGTPRTTPGRVEQPSRLSAHLAELLDRPAATAGKGGGKKQP